MILVLGKNGQLSKEFQKINKEKTVYLSSQDLDLTKIDSIAPIIQEISPNLIVNFSAYNAVDLAEEDPKNILINSLAIKEIARYSSEREIPLIHISTDYVFDGKANKPYKEKSTKNPLNVYGKTKLDGERSIQKI